jgi:hypothetical protein
MKNLLPIDPGRKMRGRSDGLPVKPPLDVTNISWKVSQNQRSWKPTGSASSAESWDSSYDQFSSQELPSSFESSTSSNANRGKVYHSFSTLAGIQSAYERDQYLENLDSSVLAQASVVDDTGFTPAYHAVNSTDGLATIELLKELGNADLNEPCAYIGANWYKPAFYAAQGNKVALIKALYYNGVDLNSVCCRDGGTPAYYAAHHGHCEMLGE